MIRKFEIPLLHSLIKFGQFKINFSLLYYMKGQAFIIYTQSYYDFVIGLKSTLKDMIKNDKCEECLN